MRPVGTKMQMVFLATGVSALALGCYSTPASRIARPDLPALLLNGPISPGVDVESAGAKTTARVAGEAVRTAQATVHPTNQSGVKARIDFVDDGTALLVTGTAEGLDPTQTYLTLIYDNGARPGGPNACRPTIFDPGDPEFLLNRMIVGFWDVDGDGNGILTAVNTNFGADYVPIGLFRAASVRRVLGPPPVPGAPPPTALEACGRVAIQDEDEE